MSELHFTDNELWNAVRCDNEAAFARLFDRYWTRVYNAAYRYLKDSEASEEVVHDIFLNIWNRRHELDIQAFENFLVTAARYQVYNKMRTAKQPLIYRDTEQFEHKAIALNKGAEHVEHEELEQRLFAYIRQLPKRCQEIFLLSRMDHLSNQEIASHLGVSKRTVENQLAVAVKHLKGCFRHIATLIIFTGLFS